jgi:hypothetical protein
MNRSTNGAKTLTGIGLKSVRERIQQAFDQARNSSPNEREIEIVEEVELTGGPTSEKKIPTLAQRADPILRVATRRFQHAVGKRHHHGAVHNVEVPTEDFDTLVRQAMTALGANSLCDRNE